MRKAQRADRKDARSAKPLCSAAGGGGLPLPVPDLLIVELTSKAPAYT